MTSVTTCYLIACISDHQLCEPAVPLDNYTAVMHHTVVIHSIEDDGEDGTNSFACCLNGCGIVCADLDELRNHQFVNHSSTIE